MTHLSQVLEITIAAFSVICTILLFCLYKSSSSLSTRIEEYEKEFEQKRAGLRGQGRGQTEEFINQDIAELRRIKDEKIAPLERKRQRFLSKIPFLK